MTVDIKSQSMNTLSIVISGSFRKHFQGISSLIQEFEGLDIQVLSPQASQITNPKDEFVILETDDTNDPKTLQERHLTAIEQADALYLYNKNSYLGASATLELGWALALGKPIYAKESSEDFTLNLCSGKIATPQEVKEDLLSRKEYSLNQISSQSSLSTLQKYMHQVTIDRGFDDETPTEIMLLMVEEIGELAKALRKQSGLKTDQAKQDAYGNLETEIADVFIYLLSLCNACNIDLAQAFKDKEGENSQRVWK